MGTWAKLDFLQEEDTFYIKLNGLIKGQHAATKLTRTHVTGALKYVEVKRHHLRESGHATY